MTFSVKAQLRRVRHLRHKARPAKTFVVLIEEGDEENEELREARAEWRPGDIIVIRELPKGWLLTAIGRRE